MNIVDKFIKEYTKEYPFYKQLAQLAHEELESEVINRGIKAIITNRAKRPERLKEKIEKRNIEKNTNQKRRFIMIS